MSEERDIPTLDDLATEIDATIAKWDGPAGELPADPVAAIKHVWSEIKNTILPLVKDLTASTSVGLMYVQDLAEPVELTGGEADEVATLLKAFAGSRPGDTALQERIAAALEPLEPDDDEDEDGDEDEETN